MKEKKNRRPRVWLIRYRDGRIESAGTDRKKAEEIARKNGGKHGGVEVII